MISIASRSRVLGCFVSSLKLQRAIASSHAATERKEKEREILSRVYAGEIQQALSLLKLAESNSQLTENGERRGFFRLKLTSHLLANGNSDPWQLLDGLHDGALSDEQFLASLLRILESDKVQNPVNAAVSFYERIVVGGFHRKRNRDQLIRAIIAAAIKDNSKYNFDDLFTLYLKLAAIEPNLSAKEERIRQRLHPASLWELIKFANLLKNKKEKQECLEKIYDFITKNGSTVQLLSFQGLWLLYHNQPVAYADFLQVHGGHGLTADLIEYISVIADAAKEPKFFECLLAFPEFFSKPELLVKICERSALLSGKADDFDALERLYKRILKIYKSKPSIYHLTLFRKVLHRISHFYKCANRVAPEDLSEMMRKAR